MTFPEIGEHRRGRKKNPHTGQKNSQIFLFIIFVFFFRDAGISVEGEPGWTGLESDISEGQLRLSAAQIKQEGKGGFSRVQRPKDAG